jgi:hypothetical protein
MDSIAAAEKLTAFPGNRKMLSPDGAISIRLVSGWI